MFIKTHHIVFSTLVLCLSFGGGPVCVFAESLPLPEEERVYTEVPLSSSAGPRQYHVGKSNLRVNRKDVEFDWGALPSPDTSVLEDEGGIQDLGKAMGVQW